VPSTIASLLASVGLQPSGSVRWGEPVPEVRPGVYIVSLTASADAVDRTFATAPLSGQALDELLEGCPDLKLDGEPNPTRAELAARIGAYWLADECVLYIGLAGQPLRTRVRQYYTTPLGAAKPHKGGWWLKALVVLRDLHVHYAATGGFRDAEEEMFRTFATAVSDTSRAAAFPDREPVMPFANLRDGHWRRRTHRITGATRAAEPSTPSPGTSRPRGTPPARWTSQARSAASSTSTTDAEVTPQHHSQKVTAKDIESGQVRIPRGATKAVLPQARQDISVRLRGRLLISRWDPRYGPPERSGVIRVGKGPAQDLLEPGDVLAVQVRDAAVELD
jgi:hypothetical protein